MARLRFLGAPRIPRERGLRTHVPEPGESWTLGGER